MKSLAPMVLILALLMSPAVSAADDDVAIGFKKLVEQQAAALVTVKFTLKVGEQQAEQKIDGAIIGKDGMVLCSHRRLGGQFGPTASVTDVKVLVGSDTDGVEAKIVRLDKDLDLAWIQINEPAEDLPALLLDKKRSIEIGDDLLSIVKMNDYFNRQPVVSEGRVGGQITKPRNMLVPTSGLVTAAGYPVFDIDGEVVGIVVNIRAESEADTQKRVETLRAQGRNVPPEAATQTIRVILPVDDVVKMTARVKAAVEAEKAEE